MSEAENVKWALCGLTCAKHLLIDLWVLNLELGATCWVDRDSTIVRQFDLVAIAPDVLLKGVCRGVGRAKVKAEYVAALVKSPQALHTDDVSIGRLIPPD